MEELNALVIRAQDGDLEAYGTVVRRLQDMAVGYAHSILGDFHLAQDAAQDAFVRAFLDLPQLRESAAFIAWFRRILFKHCDRFTRSTRVSTVPLGDLPNLASGAPDPAETAEAKEMRDRVDRAIRALPEHERTVTTLFYINGYNQNEVGEFLGIPAKTVKSRLHSARGRLREGMVDMAKEHLRKRRPSRDERFAVQVIDDLVKLSDEQIQALLRHVNPTHLALALTGTSEEVRRHVYANASEYVVAIKEAIALSGSVSTDEIEGERVRIVERAQQLVASGLGTKMSEESASRMSALRSRLEGAAFSDLSCDEIEKVFTQMAEVAIREGILALQAIADLPDDELFCLGLHLVIDGTEPEEIQAILEARTDVLIHHQETRYKVIIDGVSALGSGKHPGLVDLALKSLYIPDATRSGRGKKTSAAEPSVKRLTNKLKRTPFSQLTLDEMTDFIVGMAIVAQSEGIGCLGEMVRLIDEEFLADSLGMAVEGEVCGKTFTSLAPHLIQRILEIRMEALLRGRRVRYQMIAEGMRSIQCGDHPRIIERKMLNFHTC